MNNDLNNEFEICEGLIVKGIGGFYDVWLPHSRQHITCRARGNFRKEGLTPLAGDRVKVEARPAALGQGFLLSVETRSNVFLRPPVANMDQMAIVFSAETPVADLPLVDKLLLACSIRNIRPLILINKVDAAEGENVERYCSIYKASGFNILKVSTKSKAGMDELTAALAGYVTVLAGQSGAGKSSILNAILIEQRMITGELNKKLGRGRHTTRHAELLEMPGNGWLCDTPGFSRYDLDALPFNELDRHYPEFEPERQQCRYQGCSHIKEPGCKVQEKLAAGEIEQIRFNYYTQFYLELKDKHQNRYRA